MLPARFAVDGYGSAVGVAADPSGHQIDPAEIPAVRDSLRRTASAAGFDQTVGGVDSLAAVAAATAPGYQTFASAGLADLVDYQCCRRIADPGPAFDCVCGCASSDRFFFACLILAAFFRYPKTSFSNVVAHALTSQFAFR